MNELAGAQDLNERLISCVYCGDRFATVADSIGHPCFDPDGLALQVQVEREDGRTLALEAAARAVTSEQWVQVVALAVMAATVAVIIVAMVLAG